MLPVSYVSKGNVQWMWLGNVQVEMTHAGAELGQFGKKFLFWRKLVLNINIHFLTICWIYGKDLLFPKQIRLMDYPPPSLYPALISKGVQVCLHPLKFKNCRKIMNLVSNPWTKNVRTELCRIWCIGRIWWETEFLEKRPRAIKMTYLAEYDSKIQM